MRLRLTALLMMVAGGCASGTGDPCKNISGACITAHIQGTATTLDQLRFLVTVPSPASIVSPSTPTPFTLPVKIGITPPAGAGDSFDLGVEGLSGGNVVASDQKTINLVNNRDTVIFTLNAGTADLSMPKTEVDMAEHPDLNEPIVLSTTAPDSGTSAYELEHLTLDVTAVDPRNQALVFSTMNGPDAGVVTNPTADSFHLDWLPNWDQAGLYPMQVDVVSSVDSARTASIATPLRVLNSVDPALIINPLDSGANNPIPPTAPIGDFDGDGFADVAACSVDLVGGNAAYTVYVLFGDATGLPTAQPVPMARVKKYTFNGTTTAAASTRLSCVGADIDHDGKSDILISDPQSDNNLGQIWILFGNMDRNAASVTMQSEASASLAANEKLGNNPVLVGDFNGDGVQDFATNTYKPDNIYIFLGASARKMPLTTPWGSNRNSITTGCTGTQRTLVAVNDIDMDGHDELAVYDPNVNVVSPPGDCATNGGFTFYKEGMFAAPGTPITVKRPPGSNTSFGQGGATLCDVDNDGKADLVVPDPASGKALIYFAPFPSPLPSPAPAIVAPRAGGAYGNATCVKNFFTAARQTTVLADTAVGLPVRVDLLSSGNPPSVLRQLPVPDTTDMRYGEAFGPSADVNGDGRLDLEVGNKNGVFWIVYGR